MTTLLVHNTKWYSRSPSLNSDMFPKNTGTLSLTVSLLSLTHSLTNKSN